jgi:hypothetical protein
MAKDIVGDSNRQFAMFNDVKDAVDYSIICASVPERFLLNRCIG